MAASLLLPGTGGQARGDVATVTAAAITAGPRQMAEAAVAIDPANGRHLVAAADPYLRPVRILTAESDDGGISWRAPTTVLPDGFAKSYDPTVAVTGEGEVVVAGGASGVGLPHCQPGSSVFLATLENGTPRYQLLRDARADGAYVDRPRLGLDSRKGGRRYVTWTESSGPDASCRGTPLRSVTMFTRSLPGGFFDPPRALPGTGLPAPFGSALTVGNGVLRIVVPEFDPGKLMRVVVYTSRDEGGTIAGPTVLGEGPPVPTNLAELGGFVAPLPTVAAGPGGHAAVAWTQADSAGTLKPRVFETAGDDSWREISPSVAGMELFGTVAYDAAGRLWLLTAGPTNGRVEFRLRSRTTQWNDPLAVGAGPAGGYVEIGQFLGLAAGARSVATAVPVDGPAASTLQVSVSPAGSHLDLANETSAAHRPPGRHAQPRTWVLALAAGAVLVAIVRRRRRIRLRRARRVSAARVQGPCCDRQ